MGLPVALALAAWVLVSQGQILSPGFGDRFRRFGEYIGYTCHHLPTPAFKNTDAAPATLAARMALSSLVTRSRLK